jgi:hypothetical protein
VLTEELIQQFHKFSEKGKAYDCIDARIANHIIENNDLMVISGIPYYYASGVFRVDEKGIMIKTLIRHCIVEEVQTAPRIKRVLASGSAICCRKLTDIAQQSGYQLHLPDPAEAKKVLYEASEQILNFFKFYDGSNPYASNTPFGSNKYGLMASGRFLDDYEKQFELATANTLADIKKALTDAKETNNVDAITEAAEKLKEMVQPDSLPEEKPSKAAAFARRYSEKMGPRNGNQQPMFIQPSPGVKPKRALRPAQRPDISLDTSVSFAAQAAQRASEKAWEEAARLVDNSAEIPDVPVTF